jgi:flagellar hook-basal body complex protein FliE
MDGFTVKNANQFLNSGKLDFSSPGIDQKSVKINPSDLQGIKGSQELSANGSFVETLNNAIGKVNELQKEANVKAEELATGRTDNIAEVMIASERADIALKLMMQVRNKIIDAYQEVMKMQV